MNMKVLTGLLLLICASAPMAHADDYDRDHDRDRHGHDRDGDREHHRTTHFAWDGGTCREYAPDNNVIAPGYANTDECRRVDPTHRGWIYNNSSGFDQCAELTSRTAVVTWLDNGVCEKWHPGTPKWDGGTCREYSPAGNTVSPGYASDDTCRAVAPTHRGWMYNSNSGFSQCAELTADKAVVQWLDNDKCRYAVLTPSDFNRALKGALGSSTAGDAAVAELESNKSMTDEVAGPAELAKPVVNALD